MARILIVDDEESNRELLEAHLDGLGHQLSFAESGERALQLCQEALPDLVLLDVMMPGLNGFDTARRLKQLANEAFLPIILVSALNDPTSRVIGLRVGADEFLSKPVDSVELKVRIRNLLELGARGRALAEQNETLYQLQRFKDEMTALLVHDLKSPLTVIVVNCDYLLTSLDAFAAADAADALGDAQAAARRMVRLLSNLADVARIEDNRLELRRVTIDLAKMLEPIVAGWAHVARTRPLTLTLEADERCEVAIDADLISRVVENLIDNAFRYAKARGRVSVSLSIDRDPAGARRPVAKLRIGNSGPPVPVEARERIFEKFAQASADGGRMNLGLGLYFCRIAVEAHGGRVAVDETPDLPTVFTIDLPM